MRIRLHIVPPKGMSFTSEHTGDQIRLGRDPAGELALQGEASQSVSWNHARIDQTPAGAVLTDLKSTNGTVLNGQPVNSPQAVRAGDEIRLCFTGPTVKILELDLTAPAAPRSRPEAASKVQPPEESARPRPRRPSKGNRRQPADGFDANVTLARGRVLLHNRKGQSAQVRLRLLTEIWDCTLAADGEAAVELWGVFPRGQDFHKDNGGKGPGPLFFTTLYGLKGNVQVSKLGANGSVSSPCTVPPAQSVSWTNRDAPDELLRPSSGEQLPKWYTDQAPLQVPEKPLEAVVQAAVALQELQKGLKKKLGADRTLLEAVGNWRRESEYRAERRGAVLFLGALDALPELLEALRDTRYFEVRWTARFTLQRWIAADARHGRELYDALLKQGKLSPPTAEIILRLLHTPQPSDALNRELVEYLKHDELAVRELAHWQLTELRPDAARQVAEAVKKTHDPAALPEGREEFCQAWRKSLGLR